MKHLFAASTLAIGVAMTPAAANEHSKMLNNNNKMEMNTQGQVGTDGKIRAQGQIKTDGTATTPPANINAQNRTQGQAQGQVKSQGTVTTPPANANAQTRTQVEGQARVDTNQVDRLKETGYVTAQTQGDIYASKLIGMRIYATEQRFDPDFTVNRGDEVNWDDIGEVNDVLLGREGEVKAVILGVGGFLGIGEKDVAIEMSSLQFVRESDDPEDFFLVVNANKAQLEQAPPYLRTELQN